MDGVIQEQEKVVQKIFDTIHSSVLRNDGDPPMQYGDLPKPEKEDPGKSAMKIT